MAADVRDGGVGTKSAMPVRRSGHLGGRVVLEVTVVVLVVGLVHYLAAWSALRWVIEPFERLSSWAFTARGPYGTTSFSQGDLPALLFLALLLQAIHGTGLRTLARDLGLQASWPAALGPIVALTPLLVAIAVVAPRVAGPDQTWALPQHLAGEMVRVVFAGVLYQGYALGHLRRYGLWPWWKAATLVSVLFASADLLFTLYGPAVPGTSVLRTLAWTATAFALCFALSAACELALGSVYVSIAANFVWVLVRSVPTAGRSIVFLGAAISALALTGSVLLLRHGRSGMAPQPA